MYERCFEYIYERYDEIFRLTGCNADAILEMYDALGRVYFRILKTNFQKLLCAIEQALSQ